jgi:TPR repeat protein
MHKENPADYDALRARAGAGHIESAFRLAEALKDDADSCEDGDFKPGIRAEILDLLTQAAEGGHAGAMFRLACTLDTDRMFDEFGNWTSFDSEEAYGWLLKAVELNHPEAQAMLGSVMCESGSTRYDPAEGMKWLVTSAIQGNDKVLSEEIPYVLRELGENAEQNENLGEASTEDLELRAEWDDFRAVAELCRRINVEENVWASGEEKQKWEFLSDCISIESLDNQWENYSPDMFCALRHAARQNKAWAQKWLIDVYAGAHSPEFNPAEALRWCAKAASHGRPELVDNPMARIARALHGQASEVKKYRDAALVGIAEAQFQLGFIYFNGQGIEADRGLAIHWWSKAAENGLEKARVRLAQLRDSDEG